MNASISGYKDTDREILLNLSDKDLLATCSSNKYLFTSVCDDNFFYKKLLRTYPDTLKYFKNSSQTYKQYYLKVVYYVAKLNEEFNYSYTSGNPELQHRIFQNTKGTPSEELLHIASQLGELELVKEAIKRGANIHYNGEEALRTASLNGHLEVVKYLVSLEANIHVLNGYPLKWASAYGHLEVVKYLVSLGADISAENEAPLRMAIINGRLEVVKYLVSLGANLSKQNDYVLLVAKERGYLDVINYLRSL